MFLAPACTLWLGLGCALLELRTMAAEGAGSLVAAHPLKFAAAAAMGFGVNALAYIVIQTASSLTLKARAGRRRRGPGLGGWLCRGEPPARPVAPAGRCWVPDARCCASPFVMQVLGTVKNALVVWLGIAFLQETVTLLQACRPLPPTDTQQLARLRMHLLPPPPGPRPPAPGPHHTQGFGYALSLGAFFVYQQLKMQQLRGSSSMANLAEAGGSSGGGGGAANGRPHYVPVDAEEEPPPGKESV